MDDLEIVDDPGIKVYVKNKIPKCVGYIRPANIDKLIAWLNTVDQDTIDGKLQLTLGL
tara:strand:- start:397 stop:570 length:174 start_codon:yes stop_codon:yes gene_type:complete